MNGIEMARSYPPKLRFPLWQRKHQNELLFLCLVQKLFSVAYLNNLLSASNQIGDFFVVVVIKGMYWSHNWQQLFPDILA